MGELLSRFLDLYKRIFFFFLKTEFLRYDGVLAILVGVSRLHSSSTTIMVCISHSYCMSLSPVLERCPNFILLFSCLLRASHVARGGHALSLGLGALMQCEFCGVFVG